jgi:hypothetical protein
MHLLEPSFQRVALGCSYCLLSRWAFSTFVLSTRQKSSGVENCPLWLQKTWKGRNSQGESTQQVDRNCDFEAKTELYCVKQEVLCNAQNKINWQFKESPQIFDAIWHGEVLLVQPLHVITRICLSNVSSCAFIARLYAKNLTRCNIRFWKLLLDLSLWTFLKNGNYGEWRFTLHGCTPALHSPPDNCLQNSYLMNTFSVVLQFSGAPLDDDYSLQQT